MVYQVHVHFMKENEEFVEKETRAADNLKKYKMKHIPKNNVILKTQDISQI